MEREFYVDGVSELRDAAEEINGLIDESGCTIILLRGDMGAGKTTLTKELCALRGVSDAVTSPTFALINEYLDGEGESIYHFDFYRINDIKEVMDLGYEEYFYSGNLCLVEWPEKIEELIPSADDGAVRVGTVIIEPGDEKDARRIKLSL